MTRISPDDRKRAAEVERRMLVADINAELTAMAALDEGIAMLQKQRAGHAANMGKLAARFAELIPRKD